MSTLKKPWRSKIPSRVLYVNLLELDRVLVVDVRQSLYLIYKEAVTNTAKHTSGCTVNINLTDGADGFTVSIHDSY